MVYRPPWLPEQSMKDTAPDPRMFFHRLSVQSVFGERYILCGNCGARVPRSIVPHLKGAHRAEWVAAVADWFQLRNRGQTYRRIMKDYTQQTGQYILSWTVIKREVKAFAERENKVIRGRPRDSVSSWKPEKEIKPDTTVWTFPLRGSWAVHSPDYEGNWSPYVPREIIKRFSRKGDFVLDAFVGGGTTLIECVLLGRRGLGLDISPHALAHAQQRLEELRAAASKAVDSPLDLSALDHVEVRNGDARELSFLRDDSVDLICTHPPYGPAIPYTHSVDGDLSRLKSLDAFLDGMNAVAFEFFRVLKPGGFCAILIGDHRKDGMVQPLGFRVFQIFVEKATFVPVEIIVKLQHQDTSTEFYFGKSEELPYRIAHEYLFVFRKRANVENRKFQVPRRNQD